MARMNQKEEELILDTVNHMLKCVRYMSEVYTLELDDLGKLDNLANKFYGDDSLWWFIARVNNLTTNNIPAGTSLRIPASHNLAKGL